MKDKLPVRFCCLFQMDVQGKCSDNSPMKEYWFERCKDCGIKKNVCICAATFPSLKDFKKGGLLEDIKLPIAESEKIPDEVFNYIFPVSSFTNSKLDLIKSDNEMIKRLKVDLNYLANYLKYDRFPDLNDFEEGGIFSHIKLRRKDYSNIHDEILYYIFGRNFDKTSLSYSNKMEICDRLAYYAYLLSIK